MCYVCANPHTLTIENICGEDFCRIHNAAFGYLEREWYAIQQTYANYAIYGKHKLSSNMTLAEAIEMCDYIRSTCA